MRNVIIDIDDTLADLCSVLLEWVNERLDAPLRYEQLTRDHRESGSGEYQQLVDQALNDPQQLKVLPCRGALDAVRRLHRAGYRIHIVSARKEGWHQVTVDWLAEHGLTEFVEEIHPRRSTDKGIDFKREVARRVRPAAAFEDTLNVALTFGEMCPRTYLIDHPWNKAEIPQNVFRVPDFASAVEHFLDN